jgi:phosphoribosylanthranilate isomerase
MRTRIKICGLSRTADVAAAVAAGADAVGFVCYAPSARYIEPAQLAVVAREVPAFVTPVLLFVNATDDEVRRALDVVPAALLQFQGDETATRCASFARPYVRAVRMSPEVDLLDCERVFSDAVALLVDAPGEGFGGSGMVFDWFGLPPPAMRRKPLILAGGLHAGNVAAAIRRVRPFAVDVSSGVEEARAIKSAARIHQFVTAVRTADAETAVQ